MPSVKVGSEFGPLAWVALFPPRSRSEAENTTTPTATPATAIAATIAAMAG
jgi:hypothetical protein